MMRISRHRYRAAALLALSCIAITNAVHATSIFEFDRWMKKIEKHSLSVQRNLKRKEATGAIADAKEIQTLYKLMEDFYAKRANDADAVRISQEGIVLAINLAESASAGDFATAMKSAATLAKDCRECHNKYKPLE